MDHEGGKPAKAYIIISYIVYIYTYIVYVSI